MGACEDFEQNLNIPTSDYIQPNYECQFDPILDLYLRIGFGDIADHGIIQFTNYPNNLFSMDFKNKKFKTIPFCNMTKECSIGRQ